MFNVCPIQESEGTSFNVIALDAGDELVNVDVMGSDHGWYLVDYSGTVFLDDNSLTTDTGLSLMVDGKVKRSLPSGTCNIKMILQASKQIKIVASRTVGELVQATGSLTVTRIKPLCEAHA